MEVVIELSRKNVSQPFVHGVVLNLENQGRVGIIILGDHRGIFITYILCFFIYFSIYVNALAYIKSVLKLDYLYS